MELGNRTEYRRNKAGEYIPKQVKDTYQYIPTLQVIELVLSNDSIRELVFNETSAAENFMEKFRDGEHFKQHPFFSVNLYGIQ